MERRSIYWFRNALRLHDNPSLCDACSRSSRLLPIFIIDPSAPFAQTRGRRAGTIRANFILESLRDLNESSSSPSSSSKLNLLVAVGEPKHVMDTILQVTSADHLYYEQDPAAPVRQQDAEIFKHVHEQRDASSKPRLEIHSYATHTLHPLEKYASKCKGHVAPSQFEGFRKIFVTLKLRNEVSTISAEQIPASFDDSLINELKEKLTILSQEELLNPVTVLEQHLGYTEVAQALSNRDKGGLSFVGGERAALKLLEQQMKRTDWVGQFQKPNTKPNALTVDTTGLSPYVKHGCLSALRFYNELSKVYTTYAKKLPDQLQVTLHGQLLWREYNTLMGYTTPNFDLMVDNPVARQIPWDDDPELLAAWRDSRTGYPFIDAIMTQLRETGWIHHLARHSVACFLTRGDLWQSWEKGAEVFEDYLVDADWSINNFNWQWLSCTAHFYQFFRCYSPVAFGQKTDPNGDYIRKWLPQFKDMPSKFIYEPWTAPLAMQKKYGIVIGENYPYPIVDHKTMSKSNMTRMKEAYDAQKSGNPIPDAPQIRTMSTLPSPVNGEDESNEQAARKRQKTS